MTTTTSKNKWFCEPNNNLARVSRFLVDFFHVHCTSTTWNLLKRCFDEEFFFFFLNLDKAFENSTPAWSHAAHLKNQLTNGRAANWAKEVVFILFHVLWRCQPCIIMNTISNNYYFLVLKVSSKLLRQLKWHYAITSGTYFTSTLITFFFEKLPYLLLNLFNWYLTCSAYIWTPP